MNLGYPCINETLNAKGITTSHTMRLATFKSKGLNYLEELILTNLDALEVILKWNIEHNIKLFRISNELFPLKNQYEIKDLPRYTIIKSRLVEIGNFIKDNNIRVSFHADPYQILSSSKETVIVNTIKDLNFLSTVFDLMCLDSSPQYKINVHIGSYKPNKEDCIKRFIANFSKLSKSTQSRITIENDDKKDSYTIKDLYEVHKSIKTPIVFDYFHWALNNSGNKLENDLKLAISTWPMGIKPVVHYSSSCRDNEDNSVKITKHADYIYEKIQTFDLDLDVIIEAHSKELALFKYKELF